MQTYQLFEHTGDIGIQIFGADLPQLFEHAGLALFDLMTDLSRVQPLQSREIVVQAADREELLVNWLSELNYIFQTEYWLACQIQITDLSETRLAAIVAGQPRDPERHPIHLEIKAVTFHQLQIIQDANGFSGQVIFDV